MSCHRPVGTRGGRRDGRGPCACPAGQTIQQGEVRHAGRIPPRTGTRPPHPLHPSPCPYRTRGSHDYARHEGRILTRTGTRPPVPTVRGAAGVRWYRCWSSPFILGGAGINAPPTTWPVLVVKVHYRARGERWGHISTKEHCNGCVFFSMRHSHLSLVQTLQRWLPAL